MNSWAALTISLLVASRAVSAWGIADAGPDEGLPGNADFFVDYAQFRSGEETTIEVYVGVPLSTLTPTTAGDDKIYNFTVGAQLEDEGGEVIARDIKTKTAIISESDRRVAPLTVAGTALLAPPGRYVLVCGVGDLNAGTSRISKTDITVAGFDAGTPAFSGLEIASAIAPAGEGAESEFVKQNQQVIPNPTKFISDREKELLIYFEIYGLEGTEEYPAEYNLNYTIQLTNGKVFLKNRIPIIVTSGAVSKTVDFKLEGFPVGPYEVAVELLDESAQNKLAETSKNFVYYHETTSEEVAEVRSKYLPYTKTEAERIRREISYIANEEELKAFDAMSDEDKPIFVELFWKRRDPTPETAENEFKDAFYERFEYAETRYTTPFVAGPDTDMGYVYIKFGPPDEVTSDPAGVGSEVSFDWSTWQSEPVEIWEYYKGGKLSWFLFVDYDGDGYYYLDSSNVPGYGRYVRETRGLEE